MQTHHVTTHVLVSLVTTEMLKTSVSRKKNVSATLIQLHCHQIISGIQANVNTVSARLVESNVLRSQDLVVLENGLTGLPAQSHVDLDLETELDK